MNTATDPFNLSTANQPAKVKTVAIWHLGDDFQRGKPVFGDEAKWTAFAAGMILLHQASVGVYTHVATVSVRPGYEDTSLDYAYERTNHISRPWFLNEGVDCFAARPRSTDTGDLMMIRDTDGRRRFYIVARFGFGEVPVEVFAPALGVVV